MKCKKCFHIHKDPNTGMMICTKCNTVYEESQIVEELGFDDNQNVVGTFMDRDQKQNYKVLKKIERTAKILTIPEDVVLLAKNYYKKASSNQLTQGRKTDTVVGAVLYLACRNKKAKYLLIDFSEVLNINLFAIGILYIKIARALKITIIDIIDPSCCMARFINKLDFGNKAKEIERTAFKIFQFMKRDWITTGRTPSGLCGACILIAAKLHKLNVDINNISKVVHVCNQTIFNRIDEFSLTRVASMTMEDQKYKCQKYLM